MSKLGATSYKQTKFGIISREEVIRLEVEGTKKGLQILQSVADTMRVLSQDLIREVHKEAFNEILQDDAGSFRKIQVTYSSKEAPHFSKIPELMHSLCEDTEHALSFLPKSDQHNYIAKLIQILAQFQHRFVVIHPFVDYNGRMARLMTNYILMSLKLPIIEIKVENETERKAYISTLQKADSGDYEDIENLIAEALTESLKEIGRP